MAIYHEEIMNLDINLKGKLSINESMVLGFENAKKLIEKHLSKLAKDYQVAYYKGELDESKIDERINKILRWYLGRIKATMVYYLDDKFLDEFNNDTLPVLEYKVYSRLKKSIEISLNDLIE